MKPGSWPSIALIYLFGVAGSASLSKVIPLQQDLAQHLDASPAQFALLLSLLTIAPAALATVGGSLIDRVGAHRSLVAAAALGAAVNAGYLLAPDLRSFQVLRVIEGFILVSAYSAAPALIMATTSAQRRGPAMAFWSTYTPVGVSAGLAVSSLFAGGPAWRGGYLVHGAVWLVLVAAGLALPRPTAGGPNRAAGPGQLLAAYTQPGPLRVALCFAALVVMGFGVNTVFPSWYAQAHGTSLAAASGLLAALNLVMIGGSFAMLVLLARGQPPLRLFMILALVSLLAAALLFWPHQPAAVNITGLLLWLVASGAAIAVVTATLPQVVANPAQGASAAGLLSQMAALATFGTPPLWLWVQHSGRFAGFLAIVVVAWVLALMLLPVPRRTATTRR